MISVMRVVLAASAFLITYIDPFEPSRFVGRTHTALAVYTVYSILVCILFCSSQRSAPWLQRWGHWVDIAWFLVLIALSNGTHSIFFMFSFYAVLVASFRYGFRAGIWTAVLSSGLFLIIGYLAVAQPVEVKILSMRLLFLLVIGYVIAARGGFELTLKRRLALLKEISTLSNPRFGANRAIRENMERLRAFYDADECLAVQDARGEGRYYLRRVRRGNAEDGFRTQEISGGLAVRLLSPGPERAILFTSRPRFLFGRKCRDFRLSGQPVQPAFDSAEDLADFFETGSFISVPIPHSVLPGRVYVTARRNLFRPSDIGFIVHVMDNVASVLNNIRLVDTLASTAANEERRRLARDLHDSVIQPYIGIQFGLTALKEHLADACAGSSQAGDHPQRNLSSVNEDVDGLTKMAGTGIEELRQIVSDLRNGRARRAGLIEALQRFAGRFTDATGIGTQVEVDGEVTVDDRLAAELFRMVEEGLSNIRRHTNSPFATIRLSCPNGTLVLKMENEAATPADCRPFTPRSITERAAWLRGATRVEYQNGVCSVVVSIPLWQSAEA